MMFVEVGQGGGSGNKITPTDTTDSTNRFIRGTKRGGKNVPMSPLFDRGGPIRPFPSQLTVA